MTKEEDGSTSSSTILSSQYFQPKIVDAYLQSTLASPHFPSQALESVHTLLPTFTLTTTSFNEELMIKVGSAFDELTKRLTREEVAGLQDAIQALSGQVTFSSDASNGKCSNKDAEESAYFNTRRNRCMLGFCKILKGSWKEAIVDLDLVRADLHRKGTNNKEQSQGSVLSEEIKRIYVDALIGLQLASVLLGKGSDYDRYERWKRKAIGLD